MIQKVSMLDFRGQTKTVEFGPNLNILKGPNEIGKSTIKEVLSFVFCGTDSVGSKSPDHLISKGKDAMEAMVVTEKATIARRKRLGQTSVIKLTRHGFAPVQLNQTELSTMLRLSNDAFLCCWNVGHFMMLSQPQQFAVLGELAAVDRRALLMSMLPGGTLVPAKVKLVNPKVDADALATERRQIQNMKASDEGALAQVQQQLQALQGNQDIDTESYTKALNDVNAKLAEHDFYRTALEKYKTARLKFGESINRKGACEAGLLALRIPQQSEFDAIRAKLEANHVKYREDMASVNKLHGQLMGAPQPPQKPEELKAGDKCDKCGQAIEESHLHGVMKSYELQLKKYNEDARRIETHNDKVRKAEAKALESARAVDHDSTRLTGELEQLERVRRESAAHKAKLEQELAEISKLKDPEAPAKPEGDEAALRKEQLDINTELNMARQKATQRDGLQAQQKLLTEAIGNRMRQVDTYTRIENALRALPEEETRRLLETLKVHGVDVQLVDGVLTVTGDGVPYHSLSSGRRMKADMAFCGSLRKAAADKAPTWLFVDNADLMDKWRELLPQGLQIFAAKVDADLQQLEVIRQ